MLVITGLVKRKRESMNNKVTITAYTLKAPVTLPWHN